MIPFDNLGGHAVQFHPTRANWLISRRMAEISHSSFRNFSFPFEFK
jgi:hypothetical protein